MVGRTPVQEGGSSSSGGGVSPPVVLMSLGRDSKRGVADHFGDLGEEMRTRGRKVREAGAVPMAKAAGPSKRGPEDQGDRENVRRTLSPVEVEQMDDALIPLD